MSEFYHLSLIFAGVPKVRDLEDAFAAPADDWIRLSNNTWIIWSNQSGPALQAGLMSRLDQHIGAQDYFVMTRFDPKAMIGFLQPWVWQWINSKVPGSVHVQESYLAPTSVLQIAKKSIL